MAMCAVVIVISSVVAGLASNLIYKDKRAYLYDNAFEAAVSASGSFQRETRLKGKLAKTFAELIRSGAELDSSEAGEDLVAVGRWERSGSGEWKHVSLYSNPNVLAKKESARELREARRIFWTNLNQKEHSVSEGGFHLLKKSGIAPRLVFIDAGKKAETALQFEFSIENIARNLLNNSKFEVGIADRLANFVYHNKPYRLDRGKEEVMSVVLTENGGEKDKSAPAGVVEKIVGEEDYMFGYARANPLKGYYFVSSLATSQAYQATWALVLRAVTAALGLVGVFTLVSLFVARSVTNPLEDLMQGIQKLTSGDFEAKIPVKSNDEFAQVAEAFNLMGVKIKEANEKLKEYNRTLEAKVEDRTKDLSEANSFIKAMINSIGQGLLVFDRNGRCQSFYSSACEKLLGEDPAGKNVVNLIRPDDESTFMEWVNGLFEEMLPFKNLAELGMKSLPMDKEFTDPGFKHVALEYFPMRDEQGKVVNVVLVATDKTKEIKAQRESEERKNYVAFIGKVVKNRKSFEDFAQLFLDSLGSFSQTLEEDAPLEGEAKEEALRLLHSLKGGAGMYSLAALSKRLHDLEESVIEGAAASEIRPGVEEVLSGFQKETEKLKDFLGEESQESRGPELGQIERFRDFLADKVSEDLARIFWKEMTYPKGEVFLEPYKRLVPDLASSLGKTVPALEVSNGSVRLHPKRYQNFFNSCVHLFRNCVDHGIEPPDAREAAGKPREGKIFCSFRFGKYQGENYLVFEAGDDGGGIDPERVRAKMRQLDYEEKALAKPDDKIIYHIFDSAFSTRESASDISGRGVGLYDLAKATEELGGKIKLESELGQGSRFVFLLPYS